MTERNYRHLEGKSRRQHYVTLLIERLSGKTPIQIAESLKMERESVERDLEYVRTNWSRIFSPSDAHRESKYERPADVSIWKVKAVCCTCGADIASGAERVLVGAFELTNRVVDLDASYRRNGALVERESGGVEATGIASSSLLHCCDHCSRTVTEFTIRNPGFIEEQLRTRVGEWADPGSQTIAVQQSQEGGPARPSAAQPGKPNQRALVSEFLKDPRSRGIRAEMRLAAQMWVNDMSQREIGIKLRRDQATISRMIAAVKQRAYAHH